MNKMRYNDYVEVTRGFNQGLKGRVFTRLFWIYYFIVEDNGHNFECFWFNLKKIKREKQNE